MQVASGLRAVSETVESGLHLNHWFHHLTELVHFLGAFAAVGSVIARRTGHLEVAVPLAVGDLIASSAAGLGGKSILNNIIISSTYVLTILTMVTRSYLCHCARRRREARGRPLGGSKALPGMGVCV